MLGWSAVANNVDWAVCLPLYAGGIAWTLVYDTIYAHQVNLSSNSVEMNTLAYSEKDKDDDRQVGIRSTALLFDNNTVPILSTLSVSTLGLISYAGYANHQGLPFFIGVAMGGWRLAQILMRTNFNDRESCWAGFVGCGAVGRWIWVGAALDYLALFI